MLNEHRTVQSWGKSVRIGILSRFMCDYRRGLDWLILTTYTHGSELQELITLLLFSTLYKALHAIFSSLQCFH
jgi:hypothetical protein